MSRIEEGEGEGSDLLVVRDWRRLEWRLKLDGKWRSEREKEWKLLLNWMLRKKRERTKV
jgi:hypothetical protein